MTEWAAQNNLLNLNMIETHWICIFFYALQAAAVNKVDRVKYFQHDHWLDGFMRKNVLYFLPIS